MTGNMEKLSVSVSISSSVSSLCPWMFSSFSLLGSSCSSHVACPTSLQEKVAQPDPLLTNHLLISPYTWSPNDDLDCWGNHAQDRQNGVGEGATGIAALTGVDRAGSHACYFSSNKSLLSLMPGMREDMMGVLV